MTNSPRVDLHSMGPGLQLESGRVLGGIGRQRRQLRFQLGEVFRLFVAHVSAR